MPREKAQAAPNNSTYDLMLDGTINDYSPKDQFTNFCARVVNTGQWKTDPTPGWAVPAEPPKPPKK
jgi:hypothetical protein